MVRRTTLACLLLAAVMLVGCKASLRQGGRLTGEATSTSSNENITVETTPGGTPETLADAILRPEGAPKAGPTASQSLTLETYDGGFFTIKKPKGWRIHTAGAYGTFGFLLQDPADPARQVLYLSEVSPFYQSQKQKDIDLNYMRTTRWVVGWSDMPVVSPLTPATFFTRFEQIAKSRIGKAYMSKLPRFSGFHVLAQQAVPSSLTIGTTSLVTGYFVQGGVPCEGQFLATVAPYMAFMNGPGGGTGIAGHVVAITAPVSEFAGLEDDLAACVDSFRMSDDYVRAGIAQSRENFRGVMKAGQTLRETSAIITDGWNARNKTLDIGAQKRSDATLGYERLYDPSTGDVYRVENGFIDRYEADRNAYDMNGLRTLPSEDYPLWTATPLDGSDIH